MTKRIEHIIQEGIEQKRCCTCQAYRSLDNYNYSKQSWDNLRPECKLCLHEKRVKNKENMTEYNKQYWQKTMDIQKEKSKEWREKNKDYIKEKMKEWLENNKEHKKQKDKEYRETNWKKRKESHNNWRKKDYHDMKTNPERAKEFQEYKLKTNIGRRIREILQQNKSQRSMEYVGCSLETLKEHLTSQFQEGMSWENYGTYKFGKELLGWHIDHIIPCDSFDFSNETEVKACFYYLNLQPLWGKDNIIKSNNYNEEQKQEYLNKYKELILDI